MGFSLCPCRSRFRLLVLLVWLGAITVSARAAAAPLAELRIGYQKSSVNLLIARRLNLVERRFPGMRVRWVEFGAGPQLLEALGAGSLDFGMTGDTPPIFAQAAGRDVLYVGHETPKPDSSAILVLAGSRIESLHDLRGKRVAFQKGSSAHYLVLRALAKVGLRLSDVQPVYLAPADARAALERDGVDAWAIWDPYWAVDEGAKFFLVALGVFFPLYLNTVHGIRSVDPALLEMARSYGLSGWRLYRHVILPGAMPSILVGLRYALGLMWVLLIVAETIAASSGIGYMTMNAREFLQTDVVLVGILLYALLGKLADVAARGLERVCLRWHPSYH